MNRCCKAICGTLMAAGLCAQTAQTPQKQVVVVTGTWQPVPLEETDRSVREYQLHDAALLFGTLTDAFNLDSSVQLQSRGGVQADLSIRGGTFEQELILLDGIRLSDAQSAHHNLDIPVPIDAIERLEILHGAGSTLYGSEAVAGVANVVTLQPVHSEVRVRSGYGSFQTNEESGFAALAVNRFSERLSFERELSGGFRDDRDYRNLTAASETWLHTRLGLTRVFLSLMDRPFGADQFYGDYNSWERTKTWLATLSQDLGQRTVFTAGFRRHSDLFELFRTNPDYFTNRHKDYTVDAALRRHDPIGKWMHAYYGAELLADHVDSNNLGVHSRNQEAVYGAVSVQAASRFLVNAGLREEFFGAGQKIAVPNLSGSYWLSSKAKIRASVSRAFRLPNYTDLYYNDPANVGNPSLKPEDAVNYEGGLDLYISQKWRGSATIFDRSESNDIDYVRANDNAVWQAMNFTHVNFVGVEGRVEWQAPAHNSLDFEYTALHGAQSVLDRYQSKYAFNYPTQQGIVEWRRLTTRGFLIRGRMGITNQIDRPAYVLLDGSAAWTRYAIRPYLRVTNMTNTLYQPVYGVVQPGRAILGGLEWCILCRL
jgi:iron complex outermembrane receptor protein